MKKLLIIALLLIWSGALNSVMDTLKFHYEDSIFLIDEPRTELQEKWYQWSYTGSWKNQYVDWDGGDHRRKPLAIGPLIWLFDAWHFVKTLFLFSIFFTLWYTIGLMINRWEDPLAYRSKQWILKNYRSGWFLSAWLLLAWFLFGGTHSLLFHWILLR